MDIGYSGQQADLPEGRDDQPVSTMVSADFELDNKAYTSISVAKSAFNSFVISLK